MAVKELKVPDIGGYTDVAIVEVFVSPGDEIAEGDSLISLESDKAVMDIPAEFGGTVEKVLVAVDGTVSEGDVIATVAAADADETPPAVVEKVSKTVEKEKPEPDAVTAEPPVPAGPQPQPVTEPAMHGKASHATPSVRQYARELGISLSAVTGTGPKHRITREDVQAFVKHLVQGSRTQGGAVSGIPDIPLEDFSKYGEVERVTLSRIKRISGPHLQASWLNAPHVTHFEEADISELEAFRKRYNSRYQQKEERFSLLPYIVKAAVAVLQQFPDVNASLDAKAGELIRKRYYHIGIAVDTDDGLVVPVVRDAEKKGIAAIGREIRDLSEKARAGRLRADDFAGGTFSISSLGGIGGTGFTPIINAPQAAILGISRAAVRPFWNGSEFVPRTILPFSLSYDHRVIDGAEGARFCRALAEMLEQYEIFMV